MELKIYLRVLLKKWRVILAAFLVTLAATTVLTLNQTPTYEAVATFVVAPDSSLGEGLIYGLDTLSRRTEIGSTYAEVVVSRLIMNQAGDELGLSQDQKNALSVSSRTLAGTNLIAITAAGSDPALVRDLANTVGDKTMAYVNELYEIYELKPLDQAILPISPVGSNVVLTIALGAALGLVLGGGLAFLSEYLQASLEGAASFNVLDEESGAYNKRYFKQRLVGEMRRARRNKYPLSLALMNIDHLGVVISSLAPRTRSEAMRKAAVFLKQYLREEDVMARFDGTVFAFLLPDVPGEEARTMVEELQTRIASTSLEMEKSGVHLNLSSAAGVVACQYNGMGQDEFLVQANRALQQAEAAGNGKTSLLSRSEEQH